MDTNLSRKRWTAKGFTLLGLVVLTGWARAQSAVQAGATPDNVWQGYDWLKPAEDQQRQAASGESFQATAGQNVNDPFAVLSTGSLWQEKYGVLYTRRLDDALSLSCETSTVTLDDDSEDQCRSQKIGLQFQPVEAFTLHCDFHDSINDAPISSDSTTTSGAAISAESHLPLDGVVTLGVDSDRTTIDAPSSLDTQTNAYDAQWKQPIGQLPLSAVIKGHYEGASTGGAPATSLPSLEQSLVWKPLQDTTLQMGLRQQQYQEYPGVDHQLNEAIFADWSQKIVDDISWHSYAEVLNSRGLIDQAPASPIASGANGTPQATTPGSNPSVAGSLPVSIDDQTLTFSTGPSFKLQKDISASIEYSDRWDRNPAPGTVGDEQRVSVSLKGTF
ncbi:MAG: hypothetical protein LV480_07050 [Methylacidiphilales bacterium]|nr:hypothetical protein [Candidatus Methylacidiphilales bacterium]